MCVTLRSQWLRLGWRVKELKVPGWLIVDGGRRWLGHVAGSHATSRCGMHRCCLTSANPFSPNSVTKPPRRGQLSAAPIPRCKAPCPLHTAYTQAPHHLARLKLSKHLRPLSPDNSTTRSISPEMAFSTARPPCTLRASTAASCSRPSFGKQKRGSRSSSISIAA